MAIGLESGKLNLNQIYSAYKLALQLKGCLYAQTHVRVYVCVCVCVFVERVIFSKIDKQTITTTIS